MNAPDKNINQHPDFNKSDAAIDPNALQGKFGSATAAVTPACDEVDGKAEHSEIDGDICSVEDREIDRLERQKIHHVPQTPTIKTIAQGSAQKRRSGKGLPERQHPFTPDPQDQPNANTKAEQPKQGSGVLQNTEGCAGVVHQLQGEQVWQHW
mgnify:CR=1 FL=1